MGRPRRATAESHCLIFEFQFAGGSRSGWELHTIARFAGHRSLATTLQYIHLSGRELTFALRRGMAQVHEWRVETLASLTPDGGALQ